MKSQFFKDTQGLDKPFEKCAPDKVSVCLRLSRRAYDYAAEQAVQRRITSGQYVEGLLLREMTSETEKAPRQ